MQLSKSGSGTSLPPPEDEDEVAARTTKGRAHLSAATTTAAAAPSDEWLGVSADFLVQLRGELVGYDFGKPLDEVTTSECCELFIKVAPPSSPPPNPHVRPAAIFVAGSRQEYLFSSLAERLTRHTALLVFADGRRGSRVNRVADLRS